VDRCTASEVHEDHEGRLEEASSRGEGRSKMIFAVPDIDINNSDLDELRAHARIVAGVENQLRSYHLTVQGEIIKRVNAGFEVAHVPEKRKIYRRMSRAEIIHEGVEELDFSIE
jgi:hypothetical protein